MTPSDHHEEPKLSAAACLAGRFKRVLPTVLGVAIPLLTPLATFASSSSDEEKEVYDARILNYPKNMQLDSGSTALTWILLLFLTALCIGVLFKNPNRSHLD